ALDAGGGADGRVRVPVVGHAVGRHHDAGIRLVHGERGVGLVHRVVAELAARVAQRGGDRVAARADRGVGAVADAGEAGRDPVAALHADDRAGVAGGLAVGL